jgi:hypothetical protein
MKPHELSFESGVLPRPLALLDIGARGGVEWPWNHMSRDHLEAVFVEPDPTEAALLQQAYDR